MKKWILPLILALSFLLRVIALDKFPVGFTPDEASFGYDAYSILKTGKDQWGNAFPLVLKSFGDYKAPIYAYLTIPSVFIFGLTKFAVRLPNALIGTLAIYVLYLLSNKFFFNKKYSILITFLLAISPWHIMMSRGAFEANLITLFLPLGIYLFLIEKYYLSMIAFGINMFTYHSAKLITPLILVLLLVFFKNNLSKKIFKPLLVFGLFVILTIYTFNLGAGARIAERSITNSALEDGAKAKIVLIQNGMNPTLAKLLHNKYQVIASRFINNYLQYFSPRFLVLDGPAETTYGMIKGFGVLSYIEIFGLFLFIINFNKFKDKKIIYFLILWLLISPLPASLSTGVGYAANRAVSMIPVLQILAGIGLYKLIESNKNAKYLLGLVVIFGFIVFFQKYLIESPTKSADGMLSGNLEKAVEITNNSDKFDEIIVSKTLSEPHIYIAFAGKIDPKFYQEETKFWNFEEIGVNWV
ncbi:MAG: glycosyltransferase family 39 protein, partial [Candidatus Woesebacteria bacterium]|nr:glycosyltransferase family 39 protein [Candidatus Woesebacteria bacterium]